MNGMTEGQGRLVMVVVATLALLAVAWASHDALARDAGAPTPPGSESRDVSLTAVLNSRISYQGVLEENGTPVNGPRDMAFDFFTNDTCAGVAFHQTVENGVPVNDGFFSLALDVPHGGFYGEGVWLRVTVEATPLGCEEILPAPYALSLRPGAQVLGPPSDASGGVFEAELDGFYPMGKAVWARVATGAALSGEGYNGGYGVYAESTNGDALYAHSNSKTAGTFTSGSGYGVSVSTSGGDHWDHAGTFSAHMGYGIYAASNENMGVRAEAGDTSGLWQPVGHVGVVGIGEARGVYGSGGSGAGVSGISRESYGVYGESEGTDLTDAGVYGVGQTGPGVYGRSYGDMSGLSYAAYFYSTNYRGLYASSDTGWWAGYFDNRGGSSAPGVYIDGTLSASGSKSGYVVDVAQNTGAEPLETGDVVVIVGVADPVMGEIPVVRVEKAAEAASGAVMGVVDQPFSSGDRDGGEDVPHPAADVARAALGTAVKEGEYVSVVTLGAFKAVCVDAAYGAVQPGDLLVSSPTPGCAMRSDAPAVGTVIGKALEAWEEEQGTIAVLVTLQ